MFIKLLSHPRKHVSNNNNNNGQTSLQQQLTIPLNKYAIK